MLSNGCEFLDWFWNKYVYFGFFIDKKKIGYLVVYMGIM